MFNQSRYILKKRNQRREAGLCTQCGKPPTPGYKLCAKCRQKARFTQKQLRDKRRERGNCTKCGDVLPAGSPQRQCDGCVGDSIAIQERHRDAGRCRCGQPRREGISPITKSPYQSCEKCQERFKSWRRQRENL